MESPHCYYSKKIEGDKCWDAALSKTLDTWKNKSIFIEKYLNDDYYLDDVCKEKDGMHFIIKSI